MLKSLKKHNKVICMIIFLCIDIGINSTFDYDTLNDSIADNIRLGTFGLQVVIQICVLLVLFLATTDTLLFRVGLIGILIHTIRYALMIQPLYIAFTIAVGAYRVRHLNYLNESLSDLWKNNTFIAISFIQKTSK